MKNNNTFDIYYFVNKYKLINYILIKVVKIISEKKYKYIFNFINELLL